MTDHMDESERTEALLKKADAWSNPQQGVVAPAMTIREYDIVTALVSILRDPAPTPPSYIETVLRRIEELRRLNQRPDDAGAVERLIFDLGELVIQRMPPAVPAEAQGSQKRGASADFIVMDEAVQYVGELAHEPETAAESRVEIVHRNETLLITSPVTVLLDGGTYSQVQIKAPAYEIRNAHFQRSPQGVMIQGDVEPSEEPDASKIFAAIRAEIHHAHDNGHILDRDCQGVAPGARVPAVRVSSLMAVVERFEKGQGS